MMQMRLRGWGFDGSLSFFLCGFCPAARAFGDDFLWHGNLGEMLVLFVSWLLLGVRVVKDGSSLPPTPFSALFLQSLTWDLPFCVLGG
ncbi:hypothetical protein SUGI_0247980 [Cryptomeria japonica]|nr:hypothetical protein SUGI_0247980 [Cryptomeria japonica]